MRQTAYLLKTKCPLLRYNSSFRPQYVPVCERLQYPVPQEINALRPNGTHLHQAPYCAHSPAKDSSADCATVLFHLRIHTPARYVFCVLPLPLKYGRNVRVLKGLHKAYSRMPQSFHQSSPANPAHQLIYILWFPDCKAGISSAPHLPAT